MVFSFAFHLRFPCSSYRRAERPPNRHQREKSRRKILRVDAASDCGGCSESTAPSCSPPSPPENPDRRSHCEAATSVRSIRILSPGTRFVLQVRRHESRQPEELLMSQETRSPSLVVRFLDSFLQERNIKWVLVVGMSICSAPRSCSSPRTGTTTTLLWLGDLIVLGYSVSIHAAGQWTYHRLGLRRTGTVLQGLTVLLIPVLFLAIHWLPDRGLVESPPPLLQGLLFAATAAFAIPAAARSFRSFSARRSRCFSSAIFSWRCPERCCR